jgi:signal transduction histidine kinase/sensor domain CHASE-containing protein
MLMERGTSLKAILQRTRERLVDYLRTPDGGARFWAILVLCLSLIIWWQAILWYRSQQLAEMRLQAAEEISLKGNALFEGINRRFALLRGLQAFVLTEYKQENFDNRVSEFSANLYSKTPGILNILVAPKGLITSVYPLEGNTDLIGFDLLNALQPDLKEDVQLAVETEEIVLGFPLDYAQGGWGLAARQAIFLEDGAFWGLIGIVLDMTSLLSDVGLDSESPTLEYALLDNDGQIIFESSAFKGTPVFSYKLGIPLEEAWVLVGFPKADWDVMLVRELLPIQVGGLIIVFLLTGQVYILVNRQARLSSAVQQRTHEIAQINRSLEQRVAARTRELTTMLEVSQNVATMSDVQPLLSLILDRFQEIIPGTAVSIFLLEGDQTLKLQSYRGPFSLEELPDKWALEHADHYETVLKSHRPVIIPNVNEESALASAWRRTTTHHLGALPGYVACWMGVPLMIKKNPIGLLTLHHDEPNFFTEEQGALAMALANQAALAIENARLYEQAKQAAVLRERQRLARDLHDSVSQALYSIALGARTAQSLITRPHDDMRLKLAEPIEHILSMAEAGLSEMRALIFELRPEILEVEGLIAGLNKQAEAIQRRYDLNLQIELCDEPEVSIELKLLLFRLVQESLHNIVKHAHANNVKLVLSCTDEYIRLLIQDDGRGFDPQTSSKGLGLHSMRERVEQVEGRFDLKSCPGKGTKISIEIPINH